MNATIDKWNTKTRLASNHADKSFKALDRRILDQIDEVGLPPPVLWWSDVMSRPNGRRRFTSSLALEVSSANLLSRFSTHRLLLIGSA